MSGQLPDSLGGSLSSAPTPLTLRQVLAATDGPKQLIERAEGLAGHWAECAKRDHAWGGVAATMARLAGQARQYRDQGDVVTGYNVLSDMELRHRDEEARRLKPLLETGRRAAEQHAKLPDAGNRAKKARGARIAARYVARAREMKQRHPGLSLNSIASHLHETKPRSVPSRSVRQILRYLLAAGLR